MGREAFFAAAEGKDRLVRCFRMLRQWEDGEDVCSLYELDVETPAGAASLVMSEWHTVRDGRLPRPSWSSTRPCATRAAIELEPRTRQAALVRSRNRKRSPPRPAQHRELRAPLDSPLLAEFVAALYPINELADRSPGFVWRLQTDAGDATAVRAFDDDMLIVNMSVWESVEALGAFTYRSAHRQIMRRRRQWFERLSEPYLVLWVGRCRRHPLGWRGQGAPGRAPAR